LARNLDDPAISTPQNLQRPDFMEAKRVRRTLFSLRRLAQEYSGSNDRGMDGVADVRREQKMW
jgi:hypothetical protein